MLGGSAMTSDGISSEDWDHVHELAVAVVNADADEDTHRDRLFAFLEALVRKYGELPSLLATRADYSDDRRESERLLLRAFDFAVARADRANIREVSLSLADLYATEFSQMDDARRWLEIASEYIRPGNNSDQVEYERIRDLVRGR